MRRPIAALTLLVALAPGAAAAQPRLSIAGPRSPVERRELGPFHVLFGVPAAQRLLQSDDAMTRIRGVERLGGLGTTEAIDALVETMDGGSIVARDPRALLTAVRALAGEAKRENVRRFLMRAVAEASGSDGRGAASPLSGMLRSTAALALAKSGDKDGVGSLIAALLQGGAPAEAAARALRVYPPASLEPFVEARQQLTPALVAFLGELGDLRAAERLRGMLEKNDTAGKTAAVVALAKLGDEAALAPAREWLKRPEPRLRRAAAEALATLDAPEAPAAIAALLESEATREDGIRLALAAPSAGLAAALVKVLPSLPDDDRPRVIAAIGRARAAAPLAAMLDKPESATAAAFALATMPGDEARRAIEQALAGEAGKKGDPRRLLLRAATVRALVLDDPPAGLREGLRALFAEQAPADRAAGVFGLVAIGAMSLDDAIAAACKGPACDAAVLGAAARGALALPDGASSLDPLMPFLGRAAAEDDPRLQAEVSPDHAPEATMGAMRTAAAGAALLAHPDGGALPTSALAAWAEAGGPLAPLAARALPSRDDEALRGHVERLLAGTDPVVRAHVALGLARDPEASSVSLLTNAYRFEEDPLVRRAVVRALSRRAEPQREATLLLARDLDPDDEVRSLARAALEGRALDPALRPALGVEPRRSVAWVTIQPTEGRASGKAARAARVVRSDGLAVPVVADPDGVLIVPGLPPGLASLKVAGPEVDPRKAPDGG
jgi:HEAT repeat protein